MNRGKSNDAVTGSPSVKEATAGSAANKALKVVAGALTVFVAVVVIIGCVLVVVPNAWRAYSALSGAGSTDGGSVEYLVAKARPGSVLLVRDPGDGAADELDVSGFDDIGAEPGDLVSVRDEGGEVMMVQLTDPGRIVGADSWALVEKGAADPASIRCASRYPWFGGGDVT